MDRKIKCLQCGAILDKDTIALNRKLLNRHIARFFCLPCLGEYLSCTVDDLKVKIMEFREAGCSLFS